MKRLLSTLSILLFLFTMSASAQSPFYGPRDMGFAFANDYAKWVLKANNDVGAVAAVVTIQADGFATTPGGRVFYPLATNAPLLIDSENSASETVTPTAVTCAFGALSSTCTFSASFANAHRAPFSIRSATYGIQEAINDIKNNVNASGGTVVVANGFGGTTTTITSTVSGGSNNFNILDTRNGLFNYYKWGGSNYAVSNAPIYAGVVTLDATVTAKSGTPFLYNNPNDQSTPAHGWADIATAANATGATMDFFKTRATAAAGPATTTIVTGDVLGVMDFYGADGTNYIKTAEIQAKSAGTIAATRVPSQFTFSTGTDAAPTVMTAALILDKAQNATFNGQLFGSVGGGAAVIAPDATITAQAPAPQFFLSDVGATNAQAAIAQTGANATGVQVVGFKTRATTVGAPATTTVVTADDELAIRAFGADGTNYIESASITMTSTGTIAATRVPGKITFKTGTDAGPTVLTTALTIDKDQSSTFAGVVKNSAGLNASTGNSAGAGFPATFADSGNPAAGTTGTNTTGIAHQLWYTQIFVPYNLTATNIAVLCGGTCNTDKIAIGIWTLDGQTLLRATAATDAAGTTLSGANTWQKIALTSTLSMSGPARYLVGVVTSGATAGDIQTYPLAAGPVCAVQTGMGTLATAFTPATTTTAASCPYLFID